MFFCLSLPFLFVWLLVAFLALSPWTVAGTLVLLTVQAGSLPAGLSEGSQHVANALCLCDACRTPSGCVCRLNVLFSSLFGWTVLFGSSRCSGSCLQTSLASERDGLQSQPRRCTSVYCSLPGCCCVPLEPQAE